MRSSNSTRRMKWEISNESVKSSSRRKLIFPLIMKLSPTDTLFVKFAVFLGRRAQLEKCKCVIFTTFELRTLPEHNCGWELHTRYKDKFSSAKNNLKRGLLVRTLQMVSSYVAKLIELDSSHVEKESFQIPFERLFHQWWKFRLGYRQYDFPLLGNSIASYSTSIH